MGQAMRMYTEQREELIGDALHMFDGKKISVEVENKATNTFLFVTGVNHFTASTPHIKADSGEVYPYKLFAIRRFA